LTLLPDELECTIDEGRHKTNSQQAEGVTCPHGIKFFLIIHLIRKKIKPFAYFAPLRFKNNLQDSRPDPQSSLIQLVEGVASDFWLLLSA
jgi:hypothetical protein